MVVLPDADVDMAADAAVSAAYGSAGERCMAISVVVAVGDVAEPLVDAIKERLPGSRSGPAAIRRPRWARSSPVSIATRSPRYLDTRARRRAPTVVADGREHPLFRESDGFFLGVSLARPGDARAWTRIATRSSVPCSRSCASPPTPRRSSWSTSNPYGNGTAIFTRDGGAARQFQFEAEAGMVGINVPIPVPVAYYSFGGWKASLFGDLHMYGPEGVQFYTRAKVVTSRWPDPGTRRVDLGFPRTR